MKKIVSFILVGVLLFALLFELNGTDPNKEFSFRDYVEYVTENIDPLPEAEWEFTLNEADNADSSVVQFFKFVVRFTTYPLRLVLVVIRNGCVIFYGFLPFVGINFQFGHHDEEGEYDSNF